MLAQRVKNIEPSPTMELVTIAQKMKQQGIDVIEFGAGEPDFNTPKNIKEAGIAAINNNFTRYTPNLGIKELRDAICDKLRKDNGLNYFSDQIIVSSGAKHSIFNTIMALCEVGDEVIIPAPYWVTYPEIVKVADGIPVFVPTTLESGYKMTAEQLRQNISPKTKMLILNSPSNPTGSVYSRQELSDIAKVCVENNIYVISDEIYEKLIYDGEEHISIASFGDEIKKLTVVINGVSKAYSMTGWRIGYAAAEKEIIKAMDALQSHAASAPNSMAQKASYEAIVGNQDSVEVMVQEFDKRRKYMVEMISQIPGVTCLMPKGAFYIFPEISGLLGMKISDVEITDDIIFAKLLLEKAHVVAVPGSAFGSVGSLRFSYANSMENIKEGLQRMENLIREK